MPNIKKSNFRIMIIFWSIVMLILVVCVIIDSSKYTINGTELNQNPQKVIQTVYPDKKISLNSFTMKDSYVSSHSRIFLFDTDNKRLLICFEKNLFFNRYRIYMNFEVTPKIYTMEASDSMITYDVDLNYGKIHVYNKHLAIWSELPNFLINLAILIALSYFITGYRKKKKVLNQENNSTQGS